MRSSVLDESPDKGDSKRSSVETGLMHQVTGVVETNVVPDNDEYNDYHMRSLVKESVFKPKHHSRFSNSNEKAEEMKLKLSPIRDHKQALPSLKSLGGGVFKAPILPVLKESVSIKPALVSLKTKEREAHSRIEENRYHSSLPPQNNAYGEYDLTNIDASKALSALHRFAPNMQSYESIPDIGSANKSNSSMVVRSSQQRQNILNVNREKRTQRFRSIENEDSHIEVSHVNLPLDY